MKHTALPLLFVLLFASPFFARTGNDEDTAHAVKGVFRLRETLRDPGSLQVSLVVATNKGVCIEYRSRNNADGMSRGFAVYKTDKDLVWVENSWVWDQACVVGKYGQRREGTDATEAVSAALRAKQAVALGTQQVSNAPPVAARAVATSAPTVQPSAPPIRAETVTLTAKTSLATVAPVSVASIKAVRAAAPIAAVRRSTPTAEAAIRVAAPATVTQATTVVEPVEIPAPTAQAYVVVEVTPASTLPAPGPAHPKPAAAAAQAPPPSVRSYAVSSTPVASVELGTVRGVTIVDNAGALEKKGPPPAPESLGDAARRLKQSKRQ